MAQTSVLKRLREELESSTTLAGLDINDALNLDLLDDHNRPIVVRPGPMWHAMETLAREEMPNATPQEEQDAGPSGRP